MSLLKRQFVLTWRGYALLGLLVGALLAAVAVLNPRGPTQAFKGLMASLGLGDPVRPPKGSAGLAPGRQAAPAQDQPPPRPQAEPPAMPAANQAAGTRNIATATAATAATTPTAATTHATNAGVNLSAPGSANPNSGPRPSLTVVLVQPQAVDLRINLPATGNIAAWQEASIGAQAVGGQLAEVLAQVGDVVRRGQTLAVFATEVARADMAQLSAAEAEAESALAEAASNAQRARDVQASGALSAQQISQYLAAERAAQARLAAQRAGLRAQALRLAQSTVVAPDEGVISQRNATAGAVVPVGQELFRLIRHGRLEWRAEVPSTDLARIRPGQTARLVLPDGRSAEGRVRLIGPTVDAATRNGLVYVDLPKGSPALPGMFARGEFELGGQNALTVPNGAVQLRDGFNYVYTVGPDNRATAVKVGVGRRDGDRIEITSGLTADSRIVASGAGFLNDGDLVRVNQSVPAPARVAAAETR